MVCSCDARRSYTPHESCKRPVRAEEGDALGFGISEPSDVPPETALLKTGRKPKQSHGATVSPAFPTLHYAILLAQNVNNPATR